jgi:hypothetical protein
MVALIRILWDIIVVMFTVSLSIISSSSTPASYRQEGSHWSGTLAIALLGIVVIPIRISSILLSVVRISIRSCVYMFRHLLVSQMVSRWHRVVIKITVLVESLFILGIPICFSLQIGFRVLLYLVHLIFRWAIFRYPVLSTAICSCAKHFTLILYSLLVALINY